MNGKKIVVYIKVGRFENYYDQKSKFYDKKVKLNCMDEKLIRLKRVHTTSSWKRVPRV